MPFHRPLLRFSVRHSRGQSRDGRPSSRICFLRDSRSPVFLLWPVLDLSGLIAFRQARTTINPLAPDKSTAIVRSGPYRFTRNPMYLGMVMILLGICAYLANALSAFAVVVFVAYITRFQIMPEERLLSEKFGEPFMHYKQSVRRWL